MTHDEMTKSFREATKAPPVGAQQRVWRALQEPATPRRSAWVPVLALAASALVGVGVVKLVQSRTSSVEWSDERSAIAWNDARAQRTERRVTLEAGASESLAMAIGPDLSMLSDALERLQLYTAGAPVTTRAVDEVVTPVRELPAWGLADAVGQRNLGACLSILAQLTAQRQHALPTLGLIARQIHMLAKARAHAEGKMPGALASVLGAKPFVADKMAHVAKRWSSAHLQRAIRILAATDAALKGAKRGDERVLEECVIALCGGAGMGEGPLR